MTVAATDGRPLDAASRAPQLEVRGLDVEHAVAGMRLFTGEVSSYANGRLRRGEVIAALEGREVPLSAWSTEDAAVARPTELLELGGLYSLAILQRGVIASFTVAEEDPPVLRKLWPPFLHPRGELIYCLVVDSSSAASLPAVKDSALDPGSIVASSIWAELGHDEPAGALLELPPSGTLVDWRAGIGEEGIGRDRCITLLPRGEVPEAFVVPPQEVSGVLFDPEPTAVVMGEGTDTAPSCGVDELALADACARFEGTELVVEVGRPGAWFVQGVPSEGGASTTWWGTASPPSLTVRPFEPFSRFDIVAHRFDERGRRMSGELRASSGEPRARVVINEVLADPLGPEPQGEWIELVNVGAAPAMLLGWSIEDGGGPTPLPAVELAPGAFGLVVARDYSAAAGDDVVPLADTVPIVVERVGHRGLANGGEPLRLVDGEGRVMSAVPAIAARRAGVSVARRDPWSSDDADSFGPHAAPGASPGGPNTVH